MFKVGIIGPEASGKTTLARYLAKRYQGELVEEYARYYVEQKGDRDVSYEEVCTIACHQIEELKTISQQSNTTEKVLFFDTELIVTKVWFEEVFGASPEWLKQALREYPMDVYLLTCPDLPWTQDGARYNGSAEQRIRLFERYEQEIQALDIPYYIIKHIS